MVGDKSRLTIYGRSAEDDRLAISEQADFTSVKELAEVSLAASSADLRKLAQFIAACADEMDEMGDAYDHVHLADRLKIFEKSPHVVIFRKC